MPKRWIEWFVVATIILLLAFAAVVQRSLRTRDHLVRTTQTLLLLKVACKSYHLDFGTYPPGDPAFISRELYRALSSPRVVNGVSKPPILALASSELKDEWGNPIRYACPGVHRKDPFELWSAGADGKDGTDDDIQSWGGN